MQILQGRFCFLQYYLFYLYLWVLCPLICHHYLGDVKKIIIVKYF